MSSKLFSTLPLEKAMIDNLDSMGYAEMTAIQEQSLPLTLAGEDIIAKAKTGSGKTAAFGLSMLHKLDVKKWKVQGLIMCPTRELADQVAEELRRLARFKHNIKILTLCGGMPLTPQRISLEHGAHIVVGTPGRIQDHIGKNTLDLSNVHTLILDEADRMLDMGFLDDIKQIISHMPSERQTLLFSATYPDEINFLSRTIMKNPKTVSVEHHEEKPDIKQTFYKTSESEKDADLLKLLLHHQANATIIFCNMKVTCDEVSDYLNDMGLYALALHGDLEQRERTEVLSLFSNGSASILVATDVAARGLDVKDLDLVVNYEIPNQSEVYVHRIGRTGRAGKSGIADTLYTPREERKIPEVEEQLGTTVDYGDINKLKHNDLYSPKYATLKIDGGKKDKLRPGDIVGAITSDKTVKGDEIGNINVTAMRSYVAVERAKAKMAFNLIRDGKMKGRNFRVHLLD
ncbi:MAG: ATP-dependent RNA helicase DbpA [Sulfurimonadaceae bacterium]